MKIKSVTITIILAMASMIIMDGVAAQRRPAQRPSGKPATPKTTSAPVSSPSPTPTPIPEASLQIEAGLIFKSGDVKPVARTTFYLFDGHPGEILRDAGVKSTLTSAQSNASNPETLLFQLALSLRTQVLPESAAFVKTAMPALQPHMIQTVTTDFNGKAQFASVPPGAYYLSGFAEVGRASATWNMKISLNPGPTSLTLDNNNATDIYNRSY